MTTTTSTFDLHAFLAARRRRVDAALAEALPAPVDDPGSLKEGMRYAVLQGGKRRRPMFTIAACEAAAGATDLALPACCALEMIHAYSLVHDDLPAMDNDLERRGLPTVHVKFGEANAILIGDALLTLAFGVLARGAAGLPGERRSGRNPSQRARHERAGRSLPLTARWRLGRLTMRALWPQVVGRRLVARRGRSQGAAEAAVTGSEGGALPTILYVPDLAQLLRISEKAVRHRAARGLVPEPMRLGRALAWTREVVLGWLRESGRSAGIDDMKITLRPYAKDKSRWQVDIRLMNPCNPELEIRRRMVAPSGHDPKQARTWGERQVAVLLRELVGEGVPREAEVPAPNKVDAPTKSAASKEVARPRAQTMTLAEFYKARFEPEHVGLQKPATREYYAKVWPLYIAPALGDLPLEAIDDDRISAFRAGLRKKLAASTSNIVLSKVMKMLRYARKLRLLDTVPLAERLPEPRKRPKEIYSEEEIAGLVAAAQRHGTDALVILLLALDAGLRVSEICALEWSDVDLRAGTVLVQRSVFQGEAQTPKGKIGRIALTRSLHAALAEHQREGRYGPLVLYRCSCHTRNRWAPFTPATVWTILGKLQVEVGLKKAGPHLLRHTALTRLANLGASVYVIQAVARHAHLQTTQVYLHTQQTGLSREAANLLDRAAAAGGFGNALATLPTNGQNIAP